MLNTHRVHFQEDMVAFLGTESNKDPNVDWHPRLAIAEVYMFQLFSVHRLENDGNLQWPWVESYLVPYDPWSLNDVDRLADVDLE